MNQERTPLLKQIASVDKECEQILEETGIVEDEDLQALCYESLKDIFPGNGKKIVQRSKVWKIIQQSLKIPEASPVPALPVPTLPVPTLPVSALHVPSTSSTDSRDDFSENSSCFDEDVFEMTTPKPVLNSKVEPPTKRIKVQHPEYSVYVDSELRAVAKSGKMSTALKQRLIRSTIVNMTAAAALEPFCRYPLTVELEEMAKSLIVVYPCLRDPETGHRDLFTKLKRKLSNSKPTKKPQGACPNRSRNKQKQTSPKHTQVKEVSFQEPEKEAEATDYGCSDLPKGNTSTSCSDDGEVLDDHDNNEILRRHFKSLEKEMKKKKPDTTFVNMYLNKEYQARREWLKNIPAEKRCQELLSKYPCFTDYVEIIEETRRALKLDCVARCQFTNECVERLLSEIDFLMFYGISKGINPPRSPKLHVKLVHILKKISMIFPRPKSSKKIVELIHVLQDHEDPEVFCQKQVGNLPVLLIDEESIYLVVGGHILLQCDAAKIAEAVVAFLASFYLLDFDYPKQHELGLAVLQIIVFKDNLIPEDISVACSGMLKAYRKYKDESA